MVHVSIQKMKECMKALWKGPFCCLFPVPCCHTAQCSDTLPPSRSPTALDDSYCSWWLRLGCTQHDLGHGSSCPCQELSAQRWKHNPLKLIVMNGACSQDVVNLFYSILHFLNEAPSYMIGHLHLGLDAQWFFNTNTAPCEGKQTNSFRVDKWTEKTLWWLKKATSPFSL